MIELLQLFERPVILILAGLVCIPTMWPFARFIFEDFETFKAELGFWREFDQKLSILGFRRSNPNLYFKIICFFGGYLAIVVAVIRFWSES